MNVKISKTSHWLQPVIIMGLRQSEPSIREIKAIYITTAHLTSKKVIVLKTSWKRKLNPLNPFSLLQICIQMRSDMETDKGNMAVIDAISKNKMAVVFETDELKEMILHSDSNPTKKAYLVDVVLLTVNGKIAAYKVMALHDVIDLE